ncbi:hypothetical protein Tco_0666895 [Tanacetum coccineum]
MMIVTWNSLRRLWFRISDFGCEKNLSLFDKRSKFCKGFKEGKVFDEIFQRNLSNMVYLCVLNWIRDLNKRMLLFLIAALLLGFGSKYLINHSKAAAAMCVGMGSFRHPLEAHGRADFPVDENVYEITKRKLVLDDVMLEFGMEIENKGELLDNKTMGEIISFLLLG